MLKSLTFSSFGTETFCFRSLSQPSRRLKKEIWDRKASVILCESLLQVMSRPLSRLMSRLMKNKVCVSLYYSLWVEVTSVESTLESTQAWDESTHSKEQSSNVELKFSNVKKYFKSWNIYLQKCFTNKIEKSFNLLNGKEFILERLNWELSYWLDKI